MPCCRSHREFNRADSLSATSNYDEVANPSRVDHNRCNDLTAQINLVFSKLDAQLKAYPGELIGIVCPKREEVEFVWDKIQDSKYANRAVKLITGDDFGGLSDETLIYVCTIHAIKGLEVRSLHMLACESLKKFGHNRNMAYTAVTRAKTSLSVYYSSDIHGYFEAALLSLTAPSKLPGLTDVFKGANRCGINTVLETNCSAL